MTMKIKVFWIKVMAITLLLITTGSVNAADYRLYFLGGQSNMDGFGLNTDLPTELTKSPHNVMIFHGNSAKDGVEADGRGCGHD